MTKEDISLLVDIISCLFTVIPLGITFRFWLLDHLLEDEMEFLEKKGECIADIDACIEELDRLPVGPYAAEDRSEARYFDRLLQLMQQVERRLEVIVNYRFWGRKGYREEFKRIRDFYSDNKYLISTVARYSETDGMNSLVSVSSLEEEDKRSLFEEYRKGLVFVKVFIKEWE